MPNEPKTLHGPMTEDQQRRFEEAEMNIVSTAVLNDTWGKVGHDGRIDQQIDQTYGHIIGGGT